MSARASDPHGSSPARAEGSARVLPVGVDPYMRSCAEFLASRLAACSGTSTPDNFDGVESFEEGKIASDYPDWYSELTSYSGDLLRDALACMARGEIPRLSQREARYLVDRINAARTSGDRGMDLPPQYRHGGGARAGVKQARLRVARRTGESVARVPLRLASDVMESLRAEASARGITINALAASILEAALLGAETPAELLRASGAQGSSPDDANDDAPF